MTSNGRVKRHLRKEIISDSIPESVDKVEKIDSVRYAGFWMRLWAFLFDLLLVSAINGAIVGTWLPFIQGDSSMMEMIWSVVVIPSFLYATLFFLYFSLMTRYFSQTLGKMIFGIKVVQKDGKRLTWSTIIFREGVGRFLHQAPLPANFNLIMYVVIACTPKKQGVHDLIAETYVVHID